MGVPTGIDFDLRAADVRLANIVLGRFDLRLRAPDALHAAACRRNGYSLVTLNRRLSMAADALGVRTMLLQA